jgi:protein-L-isoaspartate(D-aspartate) O-methyltransferase
MHHHFEQARESMIEGQVRPNKVTDEALLAALRAIPREKFVPPALQDRAYIDEDIALGHSRYLMEPMVLARLLQALQVNITDAVLVVGCGMGYSVSVLALMANSVIGIEHDKHMAGEGGRLLQSLGLRNAHIMHQGDLQRGYAEKAPYDVIFIDGAVSSIPESLKAQLAEGGRLATIISRPGHGGGTGTAVLVTHRGGTFHTQNLFDASTPVLPGFEAPKAFVF